MKPKRLLLPLTLTIAALTAAALWSRLPTRPIIENQKSKIENPVQPAYDLYNAGRYREAEALAQRYIKEREDRRDLPGRKESLQARLVLAFAAARRKDYQTARQRFENLREAASALPDKGALPEPFVSPPPGGKRTSLGEEAGNPYFSPLPALGEGAGVRAESGEGPGVRSKPTLEEIGAFQSAVCTSVLDGPKAAEAAYRQFLCTYPNSVLIHGSIKRIARLHDGDIPKDAEKLWQQAVATQQRSERERERQASLCGPYCLAELLRRAGKTARVQTLARELQTDYDGTSLLALARAARKYGWKPRGLQLNTPALLHYTQPPSSKIKNRKSKIENLSLPLLTLLAPGHFVLIERVTPEQITTWDPNAHGPGNPGTRTYTPAQWTQIWPGQTLALR